VSQPRAAIGHMPFAGHRTQEEVREDEERMRYGYQLWCPEDYRSWYIELRRQGFTAIEGRAFIEEQIAADDRRQAAAK
jgi:hypothetical protein